MRGSARSARRAEVLLRSGHAELGIARSCGGSLTRWIVEGVHLLRPCSPTVRDPLESACFVLAPFSNSIEGGRFSFAGNLFPLPRNHPLEPAPIHGDAWLARWRVDRFGANAATLSYEHSGRQGFPFRYRVVQDITLKPAQLTIRLRLTNLDRSSMPAGLGVHPYFIKPPSAQLLAPHAGRWSTSGLVADMQFCHRARIKQPIDTCFVGWSRTAQLSWPQGRFYIEVSASASAWGLVVYSPRSSKFVCIEPVTHVNDGFNAMARGDSHTGVRILAPGKSMQLKVLMSVHRLRSSRRTS
jgi:aldose 1-epimerase